MTLSLDFPISTLNINQQLKGLSGVDIIFFSAQDCIVDPEAEIVRDNHGLFQMFKFMKEHLSNKNIFVSTQFSGQSNNEDVYDLSYLITPESPLPEDNPLFAYINTGIKNPLWDTLEVPESGLGTTKNWISSISRALISQLPPHKYIALSDTNDMHLDILENILHHFNSKVIILSAVNSTWTGYCSYADSNDCDKYRTRSGCDASCPALSKTHPDIPPHRVSQKFKLTERFVEKNRDSLYLNVGNSYSLGEAEKSYLFKDVKKVMIPLKNVFVPHDFETLWTHKVQNRKAFIARLMKENAHAKEISFFIMWAANDMACPQKGMEYFIVSMKILKHLLKERFNEVAVIMCAPSDPRYTSELHNLGLHYIAPGFVSTDAYNQLLSLSDVLASSVLSEAGPRTNYESAALATPLISFDRSNAIDFVTHENGALVETYDVKQFAEEMARFFHYTPEERKAASENMFTTYAEKMDTNALAQKWEKFFDECEKDSDPS